MSLRPRTRICGQYYVYHTDVTKSLIASVPIDSPQSDSFGVVNMFGPESMFMGSPASGQRCELCKQVTHTECHGHFGIVYDVPAYLNQPLISIFRNLLNVTCTSCGKILMSEQQKKIMSLSRCETIRDYYAIFEKRTATTMKKCSDCMAEVHVFKKSPTAIPGIMRMTHQQQTIVRSDELRRIYSVVYQSKEWRKMFPIFHELFLQQAYHTNLLIVPVSHRPYVVNINTDMIQTAFLNLIYTQIINIVNQYNTSRHRGIKDVTSINEALYRSLDTLMYGSNIVINQDPDATFENNDPLLKVGGKKKAVRGLMLAKTMTKCARDTAIADGNLCPGVISISQNIAKEFKYTHYANKYNIPQLASLNRGGNLWPRIIKIVRAGTIYDESVINFGTMEIQPGDEIVRDAIDGDLCILHRAPALKTTNLHTVIITVSRIDDESCAGIAMNPTEMSEMLMGDMDGDNVILIGFISNASLADMIVLLNTAQNARATKDAVCLLAMTNNGRYGLMMSTIYKPTISFQAAVYYAKKISMPIARLQRVLESFKETHMTTVNYINAFIAPYVNFENKTIMNKLDDLVSDHLTQPLVIKKRRNRARRVWSQII